MNLVKLLAISIFCLLSKQQLCKKLEDDELGKYILSKLSNIFLIDESIIEKDNESGLINLKKFDFQIYKHFITDFSFQIGLKSYAIDLNEINIRNILSKYYQLSNDVSIQFELKKIIDYSNNIEDFILRFDELLSNLIKNWTNFNSDDKNINEITENLIYVRKFVNSNYNKLTNKIMQENIMKNEPYKTTLSNYIDCFYFGSTKILLVYSDYEKKLNEVDFIKILKGMRLNERMAIYHKLLVQVHQIHQKGYCDISKLSNSISLNLENELVIYEPMNLITFDKKEGIDQYIKSVYPYELLVNDWKTIGTIIFKIEKNINNLVDDNTNNLFFEDCEYIINSFKIKLQKITGRMTYNDLVKIAYPSFREGNEYDDIVIQSKFCLFNLIMSDKKMIMLSLREYFSGINKENKKFSRSISVEDLIAIEAEMISDFYKIYNNIETESLKTII